MKRSAFAWLGWLDLPRTVFFVLAAWIFYSLVLTDPDYFWHLKAGEYLLAHGLPAGDPFSYTFAGQPWTLHEWLFEIVLYLSWAQWGDYGVKALTATLATSALYLAYAATNRVLQGSTLALVLSVVLIFFQSTGIAPRPQLVTAICCAALVHLIIGFKYFNDDRRLWVIVPLMVIWVNAHGGYIAGITLLALFCGLEWVRRIVLRQTDIARPRLMRFTLFALAGTLATAANPDFIRHWLYPFEVMNLSYAISIIQEWQSPNFQKVQNKLFLAFAFLFFLACIYRTRRPDLTEIALPLFFLTGAFVAIRHVPVAVIVLMPFAAIAIRDSVVPALYARVMGAGAQLGRREVLLNWAVVAVVCALVALGLPARQAAEKEVLSMRLPVKAVEYLKASGIEGRLFNEYSAGGYLIFALFPERKVFIDGRADVYGDPFLREYMELYTGGPRWQEILAKHDIEVLLTPVAAPIRQLLLMRGDFRAAYQDAFHAILVKDPMAPPQAGASGRERTAAVRTGAFVP